MSMKKIQVVHNPTAGDEEQNKADLIAKLNPHAGEISYVSTDKEGWEEFSLENVDLIVLCGGDGTIKKLAEVLLKRENKFRKTPIYLVPGGTANNIATTLNLQSERDFKFMNDLKNYQLFDYGKIKGLPDFKFFLESIGFGLFPELISQMNDKDEIPGESAEEKIQRTLGVCRDILQHMKPVKVKLKADGKAIKEEFLLIEVLNTKHIGPNLELAPKANPGDGMMDLVIITPDHRDLFLNYLDHLISGNEEVIDISEFVKVMKVKKIKMKSKSSIMHVDDTTLKGEEKYKFKLKVKEGGFRFI